jgi:hypothetical protein
MHEEDGLLRCEKRSEPELFWRHLAAGIFGSS